MHILIGTIPGRWHLNILKTAVLNSPVLRLADSSKPCRGITDAIEFAIAGVLLQQDSGDWHPVAYASRKLSQAEKHYTASERETLLAVVVALTTWRIYLFQHFDIYTDNMAVTYLRTKRHFSKREARWIEFLVDYHFTINHKPGKDNVADPLSRRRDLNALDSHQDQGPHLTAIEYAVELNAEVSETVSKAYAVDKEFSRNIDKLKLSDVENLHAKYFFIQTYRDAPFPARQTPREHQIAA